MVFNHILVINLVDVKEGLRGIISSDLKINVVLVISCLPKLSVRHNIGIKIRNVNYIL